jgi:carbamoyltransferase
MLAGQRFDNISAATQQYTEELIVQWVKNCMKATKIRKIACAGGIFLNVKANKLLRELPEVEKSFFYPAADDGGTPVGAALEGYYRLCEKKKIEPHKEVLADLYYGQEFKDEEIEKAIKQSKFKSQSKKVREIDEKVAELVVGGKIVARFSGRDEWGPRALGNRSIIADPRDLNVIRKINFAIKHRDFWMPFCPSILEEEMGKYLVKAKPARYMIEAFDTKPAAQEIIAGLHPYDRTCRPQTVNDWNPGWRKILEGFKKETKVGGVLNTSFNLHGFPVVGTPEVALETLAESELDILAIGNWLVERS